MLHNLPKLRLIESDRTFSYKKNKQKNQKNNKNKRGAQGLAKSFLTAQCGSHYVVGLYTICINTFK